MPVAIVDVDGTLLDGSSERLFLAHLLARRMVGAAALSRFALRYLLHPAATLAHGPGWNRGYLSGLGASATAREAERFSRSELVPCIRPAMASELRELRARGTGVLLLSASLVWLVEPLAEAVGASRVIASTPAAAGGRLTGGIEDPRPFGEDKLRAVDAFCSESGIPPSGCTAYGDSWADRHVMGFCGDAVAVNPGRKLAGLARSRGWRIIEGLQ